MADTKISDLGELTTPEAGDFLPIVDTSDTSGSPAGTTKKVDAGNFPIFDAGGKIQASVIPRTGNMSTLVGVTDAGDGEVATADDQEAQVIYRGSSPSVPSLNFQNNVIAKATLSVGFKSIANGSSYTKLAWAAGSDPLGILDDTNDEINIPTGAPFLSGDSLLCKVQGSIIPISTTAGVEWAIVLEAYDGSSWAVVAPAVFLEPSSLTGISAFNFTLVGLYNNTSALKWRLSARHSNASSLNVISGLCFVEIIELA